MAKNYWVTFYLEYENYFRVHVGDKTIKFPTNNDRLYLSKTEKVFSRKVAKEKKQEDD